MNSTTIFNLPHSLRGLTSQANLTQRQRLQAKENVLGGAVVGCLKSCQHSARRHEVAGGAASAAATRWRVARRGVVRGVSVASCVLAVVECKELWGNEL